MLPDICDGLAKDASAAGPLARTDASGRDRQGFAAGLALVNEHRSYTTATGIGVPHMFNTLMRSRRFAPLFWCQFCSALNDNFLKNALGMLILFGLGGTAGGVAQHPGVLVTLS